MSIFPSKRQIQILGILETIISDMLAWVKVNPEEAQW